MLPQMALFHSLFMDEYYSIVYVYSCCYLVAVSIYIYYTYIVV